jgi:hypothetical protein
METTTTTTTSIEEMGGFPIIIYKIITNDGYYYIGSTRSSLAQRMASHRYNCADSGDDTTLALYLKIKSLPNLWKDTRTEVIKEAFVYSGKQQYELEGEFVNSCIGDENCLNKFQIGLSTETRKELNRKRTKDYYYRNRQAVLDKRKAYYNKVRAELKAFRESANAAPCETTPAPAPQENANIVINICSQIPTPHSL